MTNFTTDIDNLKSLNFNINYENMYNLPPFITLTKISEILNSKEIVKYNICMKKIDSIDLDNILNDFFSNMFNGRYDEFIKELEKKTFISDKIDMPVTTVIYDREGNPIDYNILLESYNTIDDATIAIHEYTHALMYRNLTAYDFPYHYNELFPYLFRTIAVGDNSSENDKFSYYDAHESNQLWLLKNDIKSYFNNLKEKDNSKRIYKEHRVYGYIVADMYSLLLFDRYKEDPKKMKYLVNKVFRNKTDINTLLEYYGVGMNNQGIQEIEEKVLSLKY